MTNYYEIRLKKRHKDNLDELAAIQKRIKNHIDEDGNNILERFPYFVELIDPFKEFDRSNNFIDWLEKNITKEKFLRPWPNLVYFKNSEDAMAFKLRWI